MARHLKDRFESVSGLKEIKVQAGEEIQKIVLCHYAMRVWNASHHGAWQLFGHSHANLEEVGMQMDVGVDNALKLVGECRPFTFWEIMEVMESRPIAIVDHHHEF